MSRMTEGVPRFFPCDLSAHREERRQQAECREAYRLAMASALVAGKTDQETWALAERAYLMYEGAFPLP